MRRIIQKHNYDCGVAALAILLDKRYDTINKTIKARRGKNSGLSGRKVWRFLTTGPFACNPVFKRTKKPFADKQIVLIAWHKIQWRKHARHWIVVDKYGKVIDPGRYERYGRKAPKTLKEYPRVLGMIGINDK